MFKSPIATKLNNLPIADGAPVIINAAIIYDKLLPILKLIICSPSQFTNKVAADRVNTVRK